MRSFKPGPGFLVTAAFIGPGTITTASSAGAGYGLALGWALLLSVIMTLVFQDMSLRLGLVRRIGVSAALRDALHSQWLRWPVLALVVVAIGVGNAAYQTGNLLGAVIGAETLTGLPAPALVIGIAVIASALLASGVYRLIESVLVLLVLVMRLVFIIAMFLKPPSAADVISGLVPSLPDGATLTVLALIGTTVVPYNLFLYANIVQQRWTKETDLKDALPAARTDLAISVGIGGLITFAILATAAVSLSGEVNAASFATQLEPVLGDFAGILVASGLLAAGLTSAITAPLAAGYAVCGAFQWSTEMTDNRFRAVWIIVMLSGCGFALAQSQPVAAILVAQAANAIILPLIAIALVWLMNQGSLGEYRNRWLANTAGGLLILVTLFLGGTRLFG